MKDEKDLNISCMLLVGLVLFLVFLPLGILFIVASKLSESSNLSEDLSKAKKKAKKIEKKIEERVEPVIKNLSDRQGEILKEIIAKGEVEMSHLSAKFKKVTPRTLRRDLEKLASMGHVDKNGSTRNSVYTPKKS